MDTAGTMQCVADGPGEFASVRYTQHMSNTSPVVRHRGIARSLPNRLANTTHAVAASTRRWRLTLRGLQGGIHAALPALPVCLPLSLSLSLSLSRLPG
ncbi:hypothetical protein IA54_014860 [Xanthomonas phaseoli pv. syngonii LMG 9055]|uniref:Uncharacterized protein n=1 Tax=Xanthomonas phaseoli pv. syngonii LMG 9055 TaxID=1437878 RepID=A0A1V9GPF0_9XANT|nr:hypothetical protein IA54_014860 [Xanthomonas phaseoli pv. syngonii LMG 9055]